MSAKYRQRTWLRKHLPWALSERIPKGSHDCGEHEWYLEEEGLWRCFHCEQGRAHENPWPAAERAVVAANGIQVLFEAFEGREFGKRERATLARLENELLSAQFELGLLPELEQKSLAKRVELGMLRG